MIRGLTVVRTLSPEAQKKVAELLRALGCEEGRAWEQASSRGIPFLAPLGNLELVSGNREMLEPELLIQVSDIDTANQVASKHFSGSVSEVTDTDWKSRFFSVRIDPGLRLGFWSFTDQGSISVPTHEGGLNASGMRFGVVVSRWNSFITERLLQGALDALRRSGAKDADIQVVRVPGAFEIPSASRTVAESGSVDAVVTLGCLIRGETTHYEHIATEVTRGIGQSAQETSVPHSYGVLTCENLEQAIDRAGLKAGNKGWEAALSAIEMVSLQSKLKKRGASDGG